LALEELALDEADVWLAHLPTLAPLLDGAVALVSEAERARSRRFRRPSDGVRYLRVHKLLRLLLTAYRAETQLHWSLSHREEIAAFAVTQTGPIGVDVERIQPEFAATLSERCLTPDERSALSRLSSTDQAHRVFESWTVKEALLKRSGHGLAIEPALIGLDFADARRPTVVSSQTAEEAVADCRVELLAVAAPYVAAVAAARTCRKINGFSLDERTVLTLLARNDAATEA